MTSGQTPSARRTRTVLVVALVAVAAVVAAVLTVVVSAATYPPAPRTLSARTQVAAGADHVDPVAGLVVPVPEGWRVEPGDLVVGSTALIPESAGEAAAGQELGGFVLVGEVTPELTAAREPDNQRAAATLITGMGQSFLPIPGEPTDLRMEEISSPVGDGWALSYRVAAPGPMTAPGAAGGAGAPQSAGPDRGLVYTAVVGEGDRRYWLAYIGAPADGSIDSPEAEFGDELVERLRPSSSSGAPA